MNSEMQHGSRPGKQCLSAVLKKVLSHDLVRITKQTAAFIENDAVGCYDRLVKNLVLMLLEKLGLPTTATACLGSLWDKVIHMIKTVYGISDITYGSNEERPLYGPGQGSTCGPLFWLLCYWVMIDSMDPSITAAKFYSVCKSTLVEVTGVSFVDDTSLSTTSDYEHDSNLSEKENYASETAHIVGKLSRLAQHWERLLFTTGGAINFKKSHWYLMTWLWKNGIPKLATIKESPSSLTLTTRYSEQAEEVPRIEISEGSVLWECIYPLQEVKHFKSKNLGSTPSTITQQSQLQRSPRRRHICHTCRTSDQG
jgi:hypothetical protein